MTAASAFAQVAPSTAVAPDSSTSVSAISEQANAANYYRRAAARINELPRKLRERMTFALADFEGDSSRGPSLEVRQMLKRLQSVVSLAQAGSRRSLCRFDLAYPASGNRFQGYADARNVLHYMGLDFLARVDDGDVAGAVDDLAAMYRMAGQMPQQRELTGSMVGGAIVAFADWRLDIAFDHAIIGPVEAATLLRELQHFKGGDPMGYLPALEREKTVINETLAQRFAGETAVEDFRAAYRQSFGDDPDIETALRQLTPERLQAMFAEYGVAAERIAAAFANPDPEARDNTLSKIKIEMSEGEFAPLMDYFFPFDAVHLHDNMTRARKQIDDRRELLTKIARGEIEAMSLANAAVWYVKAVRQVPNIDPDKRRVIDAYAHKHDGPADADLTTILERHDMQHVIATLKQAAAIDRCDWSYANAGWPYVFRWFHADSLWCGRLLVADAARLFHAQRYDEAAERMAIGYRMCADIAIDGTLGGSLTAHRIFNDIDDLAAAAVDSRMLDEAQIAIMHEGMNALSRADPFHYQPAIAQLRSNMTYPMRYWVQGLPKTLPAMTKEQIAQADGLLEAMSLDDVLALAITYGYWEPSYYETRPNDMNAAIVGLESIFDVQAMRACADIAPVITEWAKSGQMALFADVQWPDIAPLEQRVQDANVEYRRGVLRFERLAR